MANMELITSVTVGSGGAASVTLPATGTIPQTYTDLKLVYSARATVAGTQEFINISFNGNTSNYSLRSLQGDGSAASSNNWSFRWIGYAVGSTATASTFSNGELYIPNYTSSNYKSFSGDNVAERNDTNAQSILTANLWSDTAAITSIALSVQGGSNFVEGSTFYLYGISNVTSGSKATGGIVSSDGTYWYHMFPYSGTFTPTSAISADVLCIAGGGGGGWPGGAGGAGGGGAGGLVYLASQSLTATGYNVTIGAGGAAITNEAGVTGSNSQFGSLTAALGGGGGGRDNTNGANPPAQANGKNGGSGGGGGVDGDATGTLPLGGTGSQGSNGGNGRNATGSGGGGGGAGGAGQTTPSRFVAGNGGIGSTTYSSWLVATQTGINGYIAGGGAGGAGGPTSSTTGGTGGLGGGGNGGGTNQTSTTGVINTGGGGGAGGYNTGTGYTGDGQRGGSGLVIIRYAI